MTTEIRQKDKEILSYLADVKHKDSGYCDDCLENELNIKTRQEVRRICENLKNEGNVDRIKSRCQICNREKTLTFIK